MTQGAAGEAVLVSLVVMAWRQEALLPEVIEAAFAQKTHSPLEIILSDDASPDGSFAVMERMAAAYNGPHEVRLNRNPQNLGVIGHVNRVSEIARGALIVYNAGDDISEPDRVARLTEVWQQGGVALVHSDVTDIDTAGRPLQRQRRRARHDQLDAKPLEEVALTRNNGIGATCAWDAALFHRFGPITETGLFEDRVLYFRARLLGGVGYVPDRLLRYRRGTGLSFDRGEGEGETRRNLEIDLATLRQRRADCLRVAPHRAEVLAALSRKIAKREGELALLDPAGADPDTLAHAQRRKDRRAARQAAKGT